MTSGIRSCINAGLDAAWPWISWWPCRTLYGLTATAGVVGYIYIRSLVGKKRDIYNACCEGETRWGPCPYNFHNSTTAKDKFCKSPAVTWDVEDILTLVDIAATILMASAALTSHRWRKIPTREETVAHPEGGQYSALQDPSAHGE